LVFKDRITNIQEQEEEQKRITSNQPTTEKEEGKMKKGYVVALALGLSLMLGMTASAAPIITYTHNYGNGAGQFDPGGNDVLSNGYVTVSDQSSDRFNDSFNFSGLSYSSIDHFDLTLSFSDTNRNLWGLPLELWYARPGGTPDQYTSFKLNAVGNSPSSQTFVIDSSLVPEFSQMVAAENFYFWFAEDGLLSNTFKLYSASLTVDGEAGTPVPEPGTMMLLGSGLVGLAGWGRKKLRK
jgi:hypothetical protein